MADDLAREALEAQGFKSPGPMLVRLVTDALVREEELAGAEARTVPFSFAAIVSDTPELIDRSRIRAPRCRGSSRASSPRRSATYWNLRESRSTACRPPAAS